MSDALKYIQELADLTQLVMKDRLIAEQVDTVAEVLISAYKKGNKTIFCGNGGSSAEAQHLAAELSGRFKFDRKPLPAEACHVNTSFVTAVSNDYDFTKVYSRYVEAFGSKGDILIGLSTSGNSKNIIEAFEIARKKEMTTIALTGSTGGTLKNFSDYIIKVPSQSVPRIQEVHLLLGHIICEKVERSLF